MRNSSGSVACNWVRTKVGVGVTVGVRVGVKVAAESLCVGVCVPPGGVIVGDTLPGTGVFTPSPGAGYALEGVAASPGAGYAPSGGG